MDDAARAWARDVERAPIARERDAPDSPDRRAGRAGAAIGPRVGQACLVGELALRGHAKHADRARALPSNVGRGANVGRAAIEAERDAVGARERAAAARDVGAGAARAVVADAA